RRRVPAAAWAARGTATAARADHGAGHAEVPRFRNGGRLMRDARHEGAPGDDVTDQESEDDPGDQEAPLFARHRRDPHGRSFSMRGTVTHPSASIKNPRLLRFAGPVPIVRA